MHAGLLPHAGLQVASVNHDDGGRVPACEFGAAAALHAIMPAGDEFKSLQSAASYLLGSKGKEPADKARRWGWHWPTCSTAGQ